MEVMSEKPRSNGGDDNKKGKKKTTKVELSLGKNGGIFILLGGALVTALISSAFRKHRKPPGGKDESHRESPAEESPEAGDEQKNNICEDEDPVRKGLQFILSDPSSLTQEHLSQFDQIFSVPRIKDDGGEGDDYNVRKEMTEEKEEKRSLKIQAPSTEEQDSPAASGCNQEIISNGSSIPGSATSSEQEYSSHPFYTHPLFDQANSEDFRLTKMNETVEEEVKEVVQEEMECSEKNVSPEMEMDLCDGQDAAIIYSSPQIQGNDDDQKNTNSEQVIITSEITQPESCHETNVQNLDLAAFHVPLHINISNQLSTTTKENGTTNEPEEEEEEEGEEVAGNDEEETNQNGTTIEPEEEEEDKTIPTIQFVAEQPCNDYCKDVVSMADEKALDQYSSMDKEGEEVAGNDEEQTNQKPEEEEDKPIPTTQFVAKQPCNDYCKGDVSMADEKALGLYSSMDKEGEEVADNDEEETNQNGTTNEPEEEEEDNQIPTIQFVAEQHCNDYCKGAVSMADEKALDQYSSMDKEGEEVAAGNDEEETNQTIEKTLGEDDTATAKQHPILPSNDKEGDEETTDEGNTECDYDEEYGYGDGDDDISEEMEESSEGVISSDESDDDGAIWPAEPAQTPLLGLKGPKEEIEDDNRTLKPEAYINLKTINNTKLQTGDLRMNTIQASARKLVILDNLFAHSLQSKRTILAGTLTLLIAYSCFCYFELPFSKPSLVIIAAVFLSKVLAG